MHAVLHCVCSDCIRVHHSDVVPYMIDMLTDTNEEVRKMADVTLDLVKVHPFTLCVCVCVCFAISHIYMYIIFSSLSTPNATYC